MSSAILTVAALLLSSCSGGDGQGAESRNDPGRAKDARPVTTHLENRDIYQSSRLYGIVEAYDPVTVTAPATGRFVAASGRANGQSVQRGTQLGFVTQCTSGGGSVGGGAFPGTLSSLSSLRLSSLGLSGTASSGAGASGAGSSGAGSSGGGPTPTPTPSSGSSGSGATGCSPSGIAVTAPAAGIVAGLREQDVDRGGTVATLQQRGLHVRLSVVDPALMFRFTDPPTTGKGELVGGPAGFAVNYERLVYDKSSGQVSVYASLPTEVTAMPGLRAVVVFVTAVKDDVPTLPLSAVHGRAESGEVVAVDGSGRTHPTKVTLGPSDELYVEVHGIDPKAKVLLYPLESDFDD